MFSDKLCDGWLPRYKNMRFFKNSIDFREAMLKATGMVHIPKDAEKDALSPLKNIEAIAS